MKIDWKLDMELIEAKLFLWREKQSFEANLIESERSSIKQVVSWKLMEEIELTLAWILIRMLNETI